VLDRVGGELVQHQRERLDPRRGQGRRRPGHDRHRRAVVARVGFQDAPDERGQVGAAPCPERQLVRDRERLAPAEEVRHERYVVREEGWHTERAG
jgi:hypothetical protein